MNINVFSIFLFTLLAFMYGCGNKNSLRENVIAGPAYELVNEWPQLSQGYVLGQPSGIGIDSNEHVFVFHRAGQGLTNPNSDSLISINTILELDNITGRILNSWGAHYFVRPHGLTVDNVNNVWVTDITLHQIFKFSHDGKLLMQLGVKNIPGNDSLHFNRPTDIAVSPDGSFYVSDGYGNSRVVKFSSAGKYLSEWGAKGTEKGEFDIPHAVTLDSIGNVYVADRQNNRIQVFDRNGKFLKELRNSEVVTQLTSVAIDTKQNLFAIDYDRTDSVVRGSTILQYNGNGDVIFRFGGGRTNERTKSWYHDICVDRYGNVYVGDILGMKLLKFRLKPIDKDKI